MSSIVTRILCSITGLLSNRLNYVNTAIMKHGDITDRRFQQLLVEELNGFKSQLNGLARKDLLTSFSFLQEGISLLRSCLDQSGPDQQAATDPVPEDQVETSRMSCVAQPKTIMSEALKLCHALGYLMWCSTFASAKGRFGEASIYATQAFCNMALSIADRTLATKFRVISTILRYLDDPGITILDCLMYLEELHSLPAICEIFSMYLNRTKSLFGNDERVEIIKSVMLINYVLFEFNLQFHGREVTNMFIWPVTIRLSNGRIFNPILDWREVAKRKSMGDNLSKLDDPYKLFIDTIVAEEKVE